MIRLRQRKMLSLAVAEAEDALVAGAPTTWTGTSPTRIVWPSASPSGKKTCAASLPRIATGRAELEVLRREAAALLDLVAVRREVVAADAPELPLLVGVGRADPRARVLLQADARDRLLVEVPAVVGVLPAQAEVRGLERRRASVVDDGGLGCTFSLSSPPSCTYSSSERGAGCRRSRSRRAPTRRRGSRRAPGGPSGRGSRASRPTSCEAARGKRR